MKSTLVVQNNPSGGVSGYRKARSDRRREIDNNGSRNKARRAGLGNPTKVPNHLGQ